MVLEVFGRDDDDDAVDAAVVDELSGEGQREGRLTGAGRGHRQEVLGPRGVELIEGRLLPGAQRSRGLGM